VLVKLITVKHAVKPSKHLTVDTGIISTFQESLTIQHKSGNSDDIG